MKELFDEEDMLFNCTHCEYKTASGKGLKIHKARKHNKKCNECDQNFPSNTSSNHICRGEIEIYEMKITNQN